MFVKIKTLLVSLCLFIAVPASAGIITITDDFDVPANTAALWDNFGGSWDHPVLVDLDLGYHGVTVSGGTAAFVANQQYFDRANLSLETLLRIDGTETDGKDVAAGFLFISGPVTTDNYDEYSIILDIDYDDDPNIVDPVRRLEVWHNNVTPGGETNTLMGAIDASITFDTFYSLQLATDSQGNIDVSLYDPSNTTLLASLSNVAHAPFTSGIIGIGATAEATFNNFSLTGNAVPIPGAVWLLGSGLLGLVGFRRKFKK